MKITIEVPDETMALIATYIYPDAEYPKMCMGTLTLGTDDIQKQREVTE